MPDLDDTATLAIAFAVLILIWGAGLKIADENRRLGAKGTYALELYLTRPVPFETPTERDRRWRALYAEHERARRQVANRLDIEYAAIRHAEQSIGFHQAQAESQLYQSADAEQAEVANLARELEDTDLPQLRRQRFRLSTR